jgi:hypothetical protein
MTPPMTAHAELIERLTATYTKTDARFGEFEGDHINPDGPEAAAHIEALAERVRGLEAALEEKRRDGFLTTWTIIRAAGGQVLVSDSIAADFAPDRALLHREEDPESGGVIMRATLSARQARKDKENATDSNR